jgi:hypothetical protein
MKENLHLLGAIVTLVLIILFYEKMIANRKTKPKWCLIILLYTLICIALNFFANGQDIYSR